jgi:hypothetical protein
VQISRLVEWRHRGCVDSTSSSCSSRLLFKPVGDPCGGGSAKCSIGNEDGAHKIVAGLFQVLNDHGFTIPAQGSTCWNDEAMGSRDFKDLDQTQEAVASTTLAAARSAVDLAKLLRHRDYPAYS